MLMLLLTNQAEDQPTVTVLPDTRPSGHFGHAERGHIEQPHSGKKL